jgi:hypothetical protein
MFACRWSVGLDDAAKVATSDAVAMLAPHTPAGAQA